MLTYTWGLGAIINLFRYTWFCVQTVFWWKFITMRRSYYIVSFISVVMVSILIIFQTDFFFPARLTCTSKLEFHLLPLCKWEIMSILYLSVMCICRETMWTTMYSIPRLGTTCCYCGCKLCYCGCQENLISFCESLATLSAFSWWNKLCAALWKTLLHVNLNPLIFEAHLGLLLQYSSASELEAQEWRT